MNSHSLAVQHGRFVLFHLGRYIRAGVEPSDLGELFEDVAVVLEVASATELRGGTA